MEIGRVATTRYSTKAFDASRTIPEAEVAEIEQLLRFTPSSTNSQPWHFVIAASEQGKEQVARAAAGAYEYNRPKLLAASHVIVLCAKASLDEADLQALLEQEQADGRFAAPGARERQDELRRHFIGLHQLESGELPHWTQKQVYLALGVLLIGAATMGIDACPMEGFDSSVLDTELELAERGLTSTVIVALGYRSTDDLNARLPKSRLPAAEVITRI